MVAFCEPMSAHGLDLKPFFVLGEGAANCGEFVAEPQMQMIRVEWVLGYITGRNRGAASARGRFTGRSFDSTDTVLGWLQSYCQAHSLNVLVQAADDLRADFQKHEGR